MEIKACAQIFSQSSSFSNSHTSTLETVLYSKKIQGLQKGDIDSAITCTEVASTSQENKKNRKYNSSSIIIQIPHPKTKIPNPQGFSHQNASFLEKKSAIKEVPKDEN